MAKLSDQPCLLTDDEKVDVWRLHVLLEAGYPRLCAERMAELHSIDLHVAVEMLKAGCPPYVAERILS